LGIRQPHSDITDLEKVVVGIMTRSGHEWNACAGIGDWKNAGRIQSVPFTDQYFKRSTFEAQTSPGTVPKLLMKVDIRLGVGS